MGGVRILLVDDEEPLVELLTRYLERLGYQVDSCLTAADALARFEADPSVYALVLTDLTLPGMKGDEMLSRMRAVAPKLRAIVASGYPYEPTAKRTRSLQKPFLPKMLAELIEELLKT
ncbi:MAG TPA: response regulator [Bryobacteraceae bacterium]|jgi:two-component system cell cycle sensor histidine kinase/response regulator CckA|nr:response regulator [Bryobacteraceae bacterium]